MTTLRRQMLVLLCAVMLCSSLFRGTVVGLAPENRSLWEKQSLGENAPPAFLSVWYGGGRFIANAGARVMASDGTDWLEVKPNISISDMVYVKDRFIGVGTQADNQGVLASSADGIEWTVHMVTGTTTPYRLAYGDGRYVATSARHIFTSTDGVKWLRQESPLAESMELTSVTYGKGQFLVVASEKMTSPFIQRFLHVALTSHNGTDWEQHAMGSYDRVAALTFGAGTFVAAGSRNTIVTSEDGVTWTTQMGDWSNHYIATVAFGNGRFVATSRFGRVFISADGKRWVEQIVDPSVDFWGVVYGSGQFVMTGNSPNVYIWREACGGFFTDMSSAHPACKALSSLAERHLVGGYPDGTFRPEATMTRAEFAKVIGLALGLAPDPATRLRFPDTGDHWAATLGLLQPVVQAGYMVGLPDGSFAPDRPITRAEVMKVVAVGAHFEPAHIKSAYGDVAETDWYATFVTAAQDNRLIGLKAVYPVWAEPEFHGTDKVTRAEAAFVLANLLAHRDAVTHQHP